MSHRIRSFRLLSVSIGAMVAAETVFFSVVVPLLPRYEDDLGLSKSMTGVLAGAFAAGMLVWALPAAKIVNRIGPRATTFAGFASLGCASVAFGFSSSIGPLVATRFVQGIAGAAIWAGALAWLTALTPVARRGEALGTAIGVAVAGALLGPTIGALATVTSTELVMSGLAAVALGTIVLAWRLLPAPTHVRGASNLRLLAGAPHRRAVGLTLWVLLMAAASYGLTFYVGPLRLDDLGATSAIIAVIFVFVAVGEAVASPLAGRLADSAGVRAPMLLALPCLALVLLGQVAIDSVVVVGVAVAVIGAVTPLLIVPNAARLSELSTSAGLGPGQSFGLLSLVFAGGNVIGSAGGGTLSGFAGYWLPIALMAGAATLTLGTLLGRRPPLRGATAPDRPAAGNDVAHEVAAPGLRDGL